MNMEIMESNIESVQSISSIDLNKILPISSSIENITYYLSDESHNSFVGNSNSSSCSGSSSGGKSSSHS